MTNKLINWVKIKEVGIRIRGRLSLLQICQEVFNVLL